MPAPPARPQPARRRYQLILALVFAVLSLMAAYVTVRLLTVFGAGGFQPADAVMAGALLLAEAFLALHGVGYFLSMVKASRQAAEAPPPSFAVPASAPVAVLIAAFNESPEVLDETITSVLALDYPATTVYLLDDSTKDECREGAAALAARYGLRLVHRTNRAGYKAGAINDLLPSLEEPYIAVLDADQRPMAHWLKDVVPLLEADPRLAFVQVPQVYVNDRGLPVAAAAKHQQAVFFEYICEGKSASNAMFCCGSNVVIRRAALLDVERRVGARRHFFDETSVTEDFATSVRMHARGWRTHYVNRTYVVGMGPETLPAYFTQQMRWAMGTLGVGLRLVGQLLRRPRSLSPAQWWEYLLSGTYYFVGFANFTFMIAPVLFLAFDVRPLRGYGELYLLAFIPYMAFTLSLVFFGLGMRGYRARGIWLASALSFATFWTYMKAGLVALSGARRAFGVTPKGVGGAIPLWRLAPELTLFAANAAAAAYGVWWMSREGVQTAFAVNTFWAAYHAALLSTLLFYLNRRVDVRGREPLFASVRHLA